MSLFFTCSVPALEVHSFDSTQPEYKVLQYRIRNKKPIHQQAFESKDAVTDFLRDEWDKGDFPFSKSAIAFWQDGKPTEFFLNEP